MYRLLDTTETPSTTPMSHSREDTPTSTAVWEFDDQRERAVRKWSYTNYK